MNKFTGLSSNEVKLRILKGKINKRVDNKTISIPLILLKNSFTLFNLLNLFLGSLIFMVHQYKNLLFLGVVFINTLISSYHEVKAKKITDKLSILTKQKIKCIRDGVEIDIDSEEIVIDDVIKLNNNNMVVSDAKIIFGTCFVNESLITGEEELIEKNKDDILLSGSMIDNGEVYAKVINVGIDNYANKIVKNVKYIKKNTSEIIKSLNKIIKFMSIVIIPLGMLLFLEQYKISNNYTKSIVNTVAAIIGMIPEGLILLTSTVFMVGVIKLYKKNVIIKNLYCIENLARVNTICFDKTGTLTKGNIKFENIIYFNKDKDLTDKLINILMSNSINYNSTSKAINKIFNIKYDVNIIEHINFSSNNKYSGVVVKDLGSIILGAPEVLTKDEKIIDIVKKYSKDFRCVLVGYTEEYYKKNDKLDIMALILLKDELRENVCEIIKYLYDENIDIKVITGDSVSTTCKVSRKAGIKNYSKAINMSKISDNCNYENLVKDYVIFARTNPFQKKSIIEALKKNNKVAYVGDGSNDVMALKESDFSITFNSASNQAKNVSDSILIDSNFENVPIILKLGRKQIYNIERSASLFLVKTIYSFLLSIIFIFLNISYPFIPIQLTLIGAITIGIPSFVLALEDTNVSASNNFLINILKKSMPCAFTIIFNIIFVTILSSIFNFNYDVLSTMCVVLTGLTGFMYLYTLCVPFNKLKSILYISLACIFLMCILFLKDLFSLSFISIKMLIIILGLFIISLFVFNILYMIINKILKEKKYLIK